MPCPPGQKGTPLVVPILLTTVEGISHLRIYLPKDLRQDQARETTWKSVVEVQRRFPDGIALLDPIANMEIKDDKFKALVKVRSQVSLSLPFLIKISRAEDRCHGAKDVLKSHT